LAGLAGAHLDLLRERDPVQCLFPQVNTYFGFQHVRIVAIAPKAGEFKATLETSLGPLPTGYSFVGRYQCLDEVLVTSLTLSLDP